MQAPRAEVRRRLLHWWGWLGLTTLALSLLVASRYFEVVDFDMTFSAMAFRAAMLLAHFTTVAVVALLPVLAVIFLWPRPRFAIPFGVLLGAAAVTADRKSVV